MSKQLDTTAQLLMTKQQFQVTERLKTNTLLSSTRMADDNANSPPLSRSRSAPLSSKHTRSDISHDSVMSRKALELDLERVARAFAENEKQKEVKWYKAVGVPLIGQEEHQGTLLFLWNIDKQFSTNAIKSKSQRNAKNQKTIASAKR